MPQSIGVYTFYRKTAQQLHYFLSVNMASIHDSNEHLQIKGNENQNNESLANTFDGIRNHQETTKLTESFKEISTAESLITLLILNVNERNRTLKRPSRTPKNGPVGHPKGQIEDEIRTENDR